jgi:hypothetical protein
VLSAESSGAGESAVESHDAVVASEASGEAASEELRTLFVSGMPLFLL